MLLGVDGPLRIPYDDYEITEKICSIALAFVMFYGGFGTKWKTARPIAKKAILLSGVGVVITALLLMLFCSYFLGINRKESFLIGAVLSSTDAASVFSILRSKRLALKYGTDSLLEVESGSNDPVSYMLTTVAIAMILGTKSSLTGMLFAQIVFGFAIGVGVAVFGIFILNNTKIVTENLDSIFMIGIVVLSYALPGLVGGNGYLSVYLTGIIIGNSAIRNKKFLVPFFDGITNLAQIGIFFILGFLSIPHKLPSIMGMALSIALFLLIIARPCMVALLLRPFKAGWKEQLCISWAGLRGASSIVFAIFAVSQLENLQIDLFHIVFMVALLSVAIQGTLLPHVSKKLDMIDEEADVLKTFNDYQEDSSLTLMRMHISKGHNWANKMVSQVSMPPDALALMIKRKGETLIPRGDTQILVGDSIILSVPSYSGAEGIQLREVLIDHKHIWCNYSIEELKLPDNVLIAMIKRGQQNIIPRGQTVIQEGDILVIYDS